VRCPKCSKDYDDSFAFCPHCGEITPEPTKECPYCEKVIKAEAIKCRYCRADLTKPVKKPRKKRHPTRWLKSQITKKRLVISAAIVVLGVGMFFSVLGLVRNYQRGHYQAGQRSLANGDWGDAIDEFQAAGGYSNAKDLSELTEKYSTALRRMDSLEWQEAYRLLKEIEEKDDHFQEVAGKLDYLEHCPDNPLSFSLWQIKNTNNCRIPVNNLLGNQMTTVGVYRGWSYANHGRPDYVGSVRIKLGYPTGGVKGAIVSASDDNRVREEGYLFVLGRPGQTFDLSDGARNYHFVITEASVNGRPTGFSDIDYGNDPIFSSLSFSISVSPK
jgi:hypothetical protein